MRRKGISMFAVIVFVAGMVLSGCGGGSSSTTAAPSSPPSQPAGGGTVEGNAK